MNIITLVFIAFLISLFIGTSAICWGLGITFGILFLIQILDHMGYLK